MGKIKPVKIADKYVGDGYPCFTISELGINVIENVKDIGLAKKMIDMSKRAGFDSVKFQLFTADDLYSRRAGTYVLEGKKIKRKDRKPAKSIRALDALAKWLDETAS